MATAGICRHIKPSQRGIADCRSGEAHIGLYPLLDGDLCSWLAADFDGQAAMLGALAYLKAARTWSVPAALEVSRSGVGAHAWVFFAVPVPAEAARRLGTALLREAMAVRGHMDLSSYDRLFSVARCAADRWCRKSDRRAAVRQGPPRRGNSIPRLVHDGTVRRPVGVSVFAGPDESW